MSHGRSPNKGVDKKRLIRFDKDESKKEEDDNYRLLAVLRPVASLSEYEAEQAVNPSPPLPSCIRLIPYETTFPADQQVSSPAPPSTVVNNVNGSSEAGAVTRIVNSFTNLDLSRETNGRRSSEASEDSSSTPVPSSTSSSCGAASDLPTEAPPPVPPRPTEDRLQQHQPKNYPLMRSDRCLYLDDTGRLTKEERYRGTYRKLSNEMIDAQCDKVMPPFVTPSGFGSRQREPGNIAMTPPSEAPVPRTPHTPLIMPRTSSPQAQLVRSPTKKIVIKTTPIDLKMAKSPPRDSTTINNYAPYADRRLSMTPPRVSLSKSPTKMMLKTPPVDAKRAQTPPRDSALARTPPRSPGVLRTRSRPTTPQQQLQQQQQRSNSHPGEVQISRSRRASSPGRQVAYEPAGPNATSTSEWTLMVDCHEHVLELPRGWFRLRHEDDLGMKHVYLVQLDVNVNDLVPTIARSILVGRDNSLQYFMYGAPVEDSDGSLPHVLPDAASLKEIIGTFASMNQEF